MSSSIDASKCQQQRFRAAYLAVRDMNISKEAFAEGVGLSVSAVQQKISDCSLPSHSHCTKEQAEEAEKLLANLLGMLRGQNQNPNQQPASEAGGNTAATEGSGSAAASSTLTSPPRRERKTAPAPSSRIRKPISKPVKVKYLFDNATGSYRFVTPDAEAVGQFDHADTIEEIITKVKQLYAPLVTLEEIYPESE